MRASGYVGFSFLLALWSAVMLSGCGGGSGGAPEPEPQPINRAPSVMLIQPAGSPATLDVTASNTLDITIKAEDPDGGTLTCMWTWDAGSVSPAEAQVAAGSNHTVTFTAPTYNGTCNLKVTISDGEAGASKDFVVQVVGNGPGIYLRITGMSIVPDPVAPGAVAALSATVDNPSGDPLTYTWKCKYGRVTNGGASSTWTAPATPGVYGVYVSVTDGTYTVSAGKVATVAGPTGGLLGQYFNTHRDNNVVVFDDMVLSRVDPTVNFAWEKLSPMPGSLPGDGFGARWTGFVKCEAPGTYVFRAHVDDGARMRMQNDSGEWIDVIPNTHENWSDHTEGAWLPAVPVPMTLSGGKWYPIELEYFEGAGDAFISLYWSVNSGPEEIIPQTSLKPLS